MTKEVMNLTLRSRKAPAGLGRGVAEYGLFFVKLDRVGNRDQYVAAFGSIRNVKLYMEDTRVKGVFKEYKSQVWLVKRLEALKSTYGFDVTLLDLG